MSASISKILALLLLLLVAAASSSSLIGPDKIKECDKDYDGPLKRIGAYHYKVSMSVCTKKYNYNVTSAIWLIIDRDMGLEPNNVVVLNADSSLDIKKVEFDEREGHKIAIKDLCRISGKQLLVVTLEESIINRTWATLTIDASAKVRDDGIGLAKADTLDMKEDSGAMKRNSVVKIHPVHTLAQNIMPCFVDDNLLSSFDLEVAHDADLEIASSKFEILKKTTKQLHGADRVVSIFNPSHSMKLSQFNFELYRRV